MSDAPPNIAQDALHHGPVRLPRRVHMQAYLLHGILKIWTRQCEVLKGASDAPVLGGVVGKLTLSGGEFGLRVDRRGGGPTVGHASAMEEVFRILMLVEEEFGGCASHLDAEEKVQHPQILERDSVGELRDDAM